MSSGTITVMGLLVVFSALAILYFFFILLGKVFSKEKPASKKIVRVEKKEEIREVKKNYVEASETASDTTGEIPVAAITAAIACAIGDDRGFSIKSIEPAGSRQVEKRSFWKNRQPQVYWRPRRNK